MLSFIHLLCKLREEDSNIKMKIFSAANPHMALYDTGSPVTALRRAYLLSYLKIVDNELLVFGNNEASKVESIGHLERLESLTSLEIRQTSLS